MSTNTQTRLEAAVKSLQQFAEEIDASGEQMSGEQMAELKNRMAEVKDLKQAVKDEAEARGEIADAKAFLKSLAPEAGGETKSARETLTTAGMAMDTHGKTFGELFTASEGYKEFVTRYAKGGVIPNAVKGVQSNPFAGGVDLKTLITGASSTSAGVSW